AAAETGRGPSATPRQRALAAEPAEAYVPRRSHEYVPRRAAADDAPRGRHARPDDAPPPPMLVRDEAPPLSLVREPEPPRRRAAGRAPVRRPEPEFEPFEEFPGDD